MTKVTGKKPLVLAKNKKNSVIFVLINIISICFMYIKRAFLVLSTVFIVGCGSSSSSNSKQISSSKSGDIFPLKVGNSFISKKDYYDLSSGKFYSTRTDTLKIVSERVLNKDTMFLTNNNNQYVINRPDGYWSENGKVLEAKYPGNVGDTFPSYTKITNDKPPDTVTGYWKIVAVNEQVTVPAGTFNCIKYDSYHKSIINGKIHNRIITWWSPGFGLIKKELYHFRENFKEPQIKDTSNELILVYREELIKEEVN
jgi:hypothetical protein